MMRKHFMFLMCNIYRWFKTPGIVGAGRVDDFSSTGQRLKIAVFMASQQRSTNY